MPLGHTQISGRGRVLDQTYRATVSLKLTARKGLLAVVQIPSIAFSVYNL
jgi:hypothetical protein